MASRREFLKIAITGTIGLAVGAIIGSSISSSKIAELESEIERLKRKLSARSSTIFPPATTRGKPEGAINIYNWSYYIQEALLDVFSQETGIPREKIVYDIFEDPAEPFAKLEAGGSGYDVMVLPDNDAGLAIRRGYVRELDKSLIPNIRFVDPPSLTRRLIPEISIV